MSSQLLFSLAREKFKETLEVNNASKSTSAVLHYSVSFADNVQDRSPHGAIDVARPIRVPRRRSLLPNPSLYQGISIMADSAVSPYLSMLIPLATSAVKMNPLMPSSGTDSEIVFAVI